MMPQTHTFNSYDLEKQSLIKQYDFNLAYAKKLVEDLTEEQMITTPSPGLENHPAFTLGHLITGSAMICEDLGGAMDIPEEWQKKWNNIFLRNGPGDPRLPSLNPADYPPKIELISELETQHKRAKVLLLSCPDSRLSAKTEWAFESYMPTLFDVILFMCVNHEAMHLGQLAAWRRAMGLPTALGKML